jgi:Flp pilus assembly protein TadB
VSAALLIGLSLVLSAASAALSWRHASRVAGATAGDTRSLAHSLRALPPEARLLELSRRAPAGSWEHRLALALLEAAAPQARVAVANDLLMELERRLDAGAGWPPAAVRLSALGAGLLATLSFLAHAGLATIVAVLAAGALGALASAAAGRAGRAAAARQREGIDALVDATLGGTVAPGASGRAARRGSRRA